MSEIKKYRVRPRFKVAVNEKLEVLTEKINTALAKPENQIEGWFKAGHGAFKPPMTEQHYWSPVLTLSIEELEGESIIRGMYGPRPVVWSMFVFFYAIVLFAIAIVSFIGLAMMSVDSASNILWLIPLLVIIFFSLYLVSFFGQRLGRDQTKELHAFIQKALEVSIED